MWRNAIVKVDELSARMEEIYDGIWAVEESMEDNKDFIINLPMMPENEDGESIAYRQVDQIGLMSLTFLSV